LQNQQVGETVRELGLAGQNEKGTPTMGGLIIIFATLVPVMFVCKTAKYLRVVVDRNYFVDGNHFIDDYIKYLKKIKQGLKGILKYSGRWIRLIVGAVL
jgi:phospho-N-acetylmuramoyl-pentapeptide-transferase